MTIPDGAAGDPVEHADALPRKVFGALDRPVIAHIDVTRHEVAQHENRQCDVASVALLDAAQLPGHRGFAAMYRGIVQGAAHHFLPVIPGCRLAGSETEVDAVK